MTKTLKDNPIKLELFTGNFFVSSRVPRIDYPLHDCSHFSVIHHFAHKFDEYRKQPSSVRLRCGSNETQSDFTVIPVYTSKPSLAGPLITLAGYQIYKVYRDTK